MAAIQPVWNNVIGFCAALLCTKVKISLDLILRLKAPTFDTSLSTYAYGPPRKIGKKSRCFAFVSVYGKICLKWPQMEPGGFFPTNPDLANILGRTDFDFEHFHFFFIFWIPNSRISRFQISKFPEIWPGTGLGGAGPGLGLWPGGPLGWARGALGWAAGPSGGPIGNPQARTEMINPSL